MACVYCEQGVRPGEDGVVCPRHARETLLITPLLAALATLRGPAFMGADDRAKCARLIDTVVARLSNEKLIHLFADLPASSSDLPASMPVDDTRVAAPGVTTERTP